MDIPILTVEDLVAGTESRRRPYHRGYLAMYSSVWGGIVTDPVWMTVPADDHLVHRADGVFDFFRVSGGRAYGLKEHLARLESSAGKLDIKMPAEYAHILDILKAVIRVGGAIDVGVRIFVTRGPGGFSTNPYECPASQIYVIATRLKKPDESAYENGVPIISASVPVKPKAFAGIKSADYLGNVLIKKAAVEAGVDYAVTWDEEGFLSEGATENIMLVSPERELLIPSFDRSLKGITITRVAQLAETLIGEGLLAAIRVAKIDRPEAERCNEVMLTGTSLDVLPVTTWDGRRIGGGRPGPVARRLLDLMRRDIASNQELLTDLTGD